MRAALRVLVVDDSAMNRRVLSGLLTALPNVQVIGTAADGDEALRVVSEKNPDLITLDLEMPRMDGFTFLRLLMASRPTPVIVISSHDGRESVFRALELGAIDFVAKPSAMLTGQTEAIRQQLEEVVALVRQLAPSGPWRKTRGTMDFGPTRQPSRSLRHPQGRLAAGPPPRAFSRSGHRRVDRWADRADGAVRTALRDQPRRDRRGAAHAGALHEELRRAAR
jgi:chemotaxis response regulator CheB